MKASASGIELPMELLRRSFVGLDVHSLCSASSATTSWAKVVGDGSAHSELWQHALLAFQQPAEAPGTYSTVFTREGVAAFLAMTARHSVNQEAINALAKWHEQCALRRLVAAPTLCHLARFTRLAHSGVEAEVLKVRRRGTMLAIHVALEVLNFFAVPLWVLVAVSREAPRQMVHGCQNRAVFTMRGYMHGTSCAEAPPVSHGGAIVLCSGRFSEDPSACTDMIYCQPYSRVVLGEHVFYVDEESQLKLHFAFVTQIRLTAERKDLKTVVNPVCCTNSENSAEILIPTTRGDHYPMSAEEWESRGAPPGIGNALLVSSGIPNEHDSVQASWIAHEPWVDIYHESIALDVASSETLFWGSVDLEQDLTSHLC